MTRETVRLVFGPFDGQTRQVDPGRRILTEEWVVEEVDREGWLDGRTITVKRLEVATYRRMSRVTFVHCRTPTGLGDRNLDLPETQLSLEEDP